MSVCSAACNSKHKPPPPPPPTTNPSSFSTEIPPQQKFTSTHANHAHASPGPPGPGHPLVRPPPARSRHTRTPLMPLWDTANPQLKNLVAYEPGKPIDEVARELGLDPSEIVKLASNENPLGPSPKAKVAMAAAMDHAHIYPDGGGYRLRHAIAEKFGMNMKNVILGNGSNEIIELIGHAFLRPGDEVVTAQHAFVVYKLMATLFGATTI